MTDIDYQELFRSPLGDPDRDGQSGWGIVFAGFVLGAVVAIVIAALIGDEEQPANAATTSLPMTLAGAAANVVAQEYPPGYVEIGTSIAAKPVELIVGDETVVLAFSLASARDTDPLESAWPVGGTWWLEAADGTGVESTRVILGRFSPAAYAVEFPTVSFADQTSFGRARMIETWEHPAVTGVATVPFDGEPFAMAEPLVIPISQDTTLIVERLDLGRFLGRVDWVIEGPGAPLARVVISANLLDSEDEDVGRYASFPVVLDPADRGVTEILWQEPFPTGQEGAVAVVVEYSVGVVEVVPTDIVVDLGDVPLAR